MCLNTFIKSDSLKESPLVYEIRQRGEDQHVILTVEALHSMMPETAEPSSPDNERTRARANSNPEQRRPNFESYIPGLVLDPSVRPTEDEEQLLFAMMELMAAAFTLLAAHKETSALHVWAIVATICSSDGLKKFLHGFQTIQTAINNRAMTDLDIPSTVNLERDAIEQIARAWRRLVDLDRFVDAQVLEDLAKRIFGEERWVVELVKRAVSATPDYTY